MTDTATKPEATEKEKRQIAPRDVDYELTVHEDLPTTSNRGSTLEQQLMKVQADVEDPENETTAKHWVRIAAYKGNGACGSASQALRKRHGKPEVEGWHFASRKLENGRYGLFVRWDPSVVKEGAKAEFEREREAAKAGNAGGRKQTATEGSKQAAARQEGAKK